MNVDFPRVSIIIPLHVISKRFFKDLAHYAALDYPDFEVLVVCDKKVNIGNEKTRLILTGSLKETGPAEKRDWALKKATGEIIAFIDDDAYPHKDWLKNAIPYFTNKTIGAVGGPGLTPRADDFWQQAGGAIYESFLGSGMYRYRFVPQKLRKVDDFPAYNLLIKKDVLDKIGGFNSTYYGGEDTKVCLEIVKAGYTILYAPNVVVFHHRRRLFREHMAQIKNVGIHRGYFVKVYPETSCKVIYFVPSLSYVLSLSALIIFIINYKIGFLFLFIFIVLLVTAIICIYQKKKDMRISLAASIGLIVHHLAYGHGFLKGLLTKKLKR